MAKRLLRTAGPFPANCIHDIASATTGAPPGSVERHGLLLSASPSLAGGNVLRQGSHPNRGGGRAAAETSTC